MKSIKTQNSMKKAKGEIHIMKKRSLKKEKLAALVKELATELNSFDWTPYLVNEAPASHEMTASVNRGEKKNG